MRGIVAFVRTVTAGSFSAAARQLGVTTVAISRNVQRLEQQLGVRLLQRTTRSLSMTEEGRRFFEATRNALLARDLPRGAGACAQVVLLERQTRRELPGEKCEIRAIGRNVLEPGTRNHAVLVLAEYLLQRFCARRDGLGPVGVDHRERLGRVARLLRAAPHRYTRYACE